MTTTQPAGGALTSSSDWAGSPMSTLHHMPAQPQPIPAEQYADGTGYVIRLEVPGIDPASDLTVSVETGTIVVRAERRDNAPEGRQTEFRYGHFARRIALPLGADAGDVCASYHDGILTVRIGLSPSISRPRAPSTSRSRRNPLARTARPLRGQEIIMNSRASSPVIVVGVSGSAASAGALRWAADEADRRHGRLRVFCVWQAESHAFYAHPAGGPEAAALQHRRASAVPGRDAAGCSRLAATGQHHRRGRRWHT